MDKMLGIFFSLIHAHICCGQTVQYPAKNGLFSRFSALCMIISGFPLEWPWVGTPSKLENNFFGKTTNNQMKKRQLDQACKTTQGSFVSSQTICSSCCILVMMATQLWRIFAKRFPPPRSSSTFSFAIYNQIHRIVLILDVNSLWMFFIQDIFFAYFFESLLSLLNFF